MLLEIALQLPVLLDFRLKGLQGLAGLVALREKTLETPSRFRPELFEFGFGRVGFGCRGGLGIRRGLVPACRSRCLVLGGLVPGLSIRVIRGDG